MTGHPTPSAAVVGRLSRLPLRVRLVAGFVVAMTVVLTLAGGFVYWRVRVALDAGLDHDLDDQMTAIRSLVGPDGRVRDDPGAPASPALRDHQVLSATGAVLSTGSGRPPCRWSAART